MASVSRNENNDLNKYQSSATLYDSFNRLARFSSQIAQYGEDCHSG